MKNKALETQVCNDNTAVLTNALELGGQILEGVIGNDVSNAIEGKPVTPAYIRESLAAKLNANFAPYMGGR